ncbi:hypothetical protein L6452_13951 [Arctium lappa]|uniref:Uncharacterized protein n=1 Tax=Arctium lappa TaxID=4217 RepID=A0ACB9CJM9_ARCLA|nr:hypothetical protein L6452_13951 [Arctium lappa]
MMMSQNCAVFFLVFELLLRISSMVSCLNGNTNDQCSKKLVIVLSHQVTLRLTLTRGLDVTDMRAQLSAPVDGATLGCA